MVRSSLLSFDDFALNSVLARGGFCTVYSGVMLRGAWLGESCAVKTISDNEELLRNESTMRGLTANSTPYTRPCSATVDVYKQTCSTSAVV